MTKSNLSIFGIAVGFLLLFLFVESDRVSAGDELGRLNDTVAMVIDANKTIRQKSVEPIAPASKAIEFQRFSDRIVFGFDHDRVCYIEIRHEDFHGSLYAAQSYVTEYGNSRERKSTWVVDIEQAKSYPPIFTQGLRSEWLGENVQWRPETLERRETVIRYYDGYGKFLGSRVMNRSMGFTMSPYVSGIWKNYPATDTYLKVPLIRTDWAAYAIFDLANEGDVQGVSTSRIFIAKADFYWKALFSGTSRPKTKYERQFKKFVSPALLPQASLMRRLNDITAATDNPRIAAHDIKSAADSVASRVLGQRLSQLMEKKSIISQQRRAMMIAEFDLRSAVPTLIRLLSKRQTDIKTKTAIVKSLGRIAKRIPDVPAPSSTDHNAWNRWWTKARVKSRDQLQR